MCLMVQKVITNMVHCVQSAFTLIIIKLVGHSNENMVGAYLVGVLMTILILIQFLVFTTDLYF